MTDAGYSGTLLARKVGLKPDHRLLLMHRPPGWDIPDLPPGVRVTGRSVTQADLVIAFYRSRGDLERDIAIFTSQLPPSVPLWIAWPRRAAGHTSDITENGLRELLLPTGLVDVKVAALDHDWSSLKFVWRKEHRRA